MKVDSKCDHLREVLLQVVRLCECERGRETRVRLGDTDRRDEILKFGYIFKFVIDVPREREPYPPRR